MKKYLKTSLLIIMVILSSIFVLKFNKKQNIVYAENSNIEQKIYMVHGGINYTSTMTNIAPVTIKLSSSINNAQFEYAINDSIVETGNEFTLTNKGDYTIRVWIIEDGVKDDNYIDFGVTLLDLGATVPSGDIADYYLRNYLQHFANTHGYSAMYENMLIADGSFKKMEYHDSKLSDLTGLEKFNLSQITEIDFSKNQITTIPQKAFASATNLQVLNLSNNLLTSLTIDSYSRNIYLNNNQMKTITLRDTNLEYLDISNNKFAQTDTIIGKTNGITIYNKMVNGIESNDYEKYKIIAYNNLLTRSEPGCVDDSFYLGLQGMDKHTPSSTQSSNDCDYIMYSNSGKSNLFKLYCYRFDKICVGKDDEGNLIYDDIECYLSMLNNQTGEYEEVYVFDIDIPVGDDAGTIAHYYDQFVPKSGYYKIGYRTKTTGGPIYELDSNYERILLSDFYGEINYKLNETFTDKILKAIPYAEANTYIIYDGVTYSNDMISKVPATIKLYSTIENVDFEYTINGFGVDVINGGTESQQIIPFSGDEVNLKVAGMYVVRVWVIENGVKSNYVDFHVKLVANREVTVENWIFLILGIALIIFFTFFLLIRNNNKFMSKKENDFEW